MKRQRVHFWGLFHYSHPLLYNYHDGGGAIGYLTTRLGGGAMMGETPSFWGVIFFRKLRSQRDITTRHWSNTQRLDRKY